MVFYCYSVVLLLSRLAGVSSYWAAFMWKGFCEERPVAGVSSVSLKGVSC
jgi:hypothetical protein